MLARPTGSPRYIVYCRAYAAASVVHLTLPDAFDPRWLPANVAYFVGAALLAFSGSLAGWALCAVGLALPLLFWEDQLTQSVYLLGCALGALACFSGSAKRRDERLSRTFPAIVRVLTVGVYAMAALHKVNRDFFDPTVSCANGGVRILADNWNVLGLAHPAMEPVWPHLFLAAEIAVATLLVIRPAWGMLVAIFMHIPLTIVFAPSFAFVMISGWVCLLTEREVSFLGKVLRARWKWIVPIGMSLGAISFWLYMQRHWVVSPFWSFKEALLWTGLVWIVFALARRAPGVLSWWSAWRERGPKSARWGPVVAGALFIAHGLTPYTGLQFHHTGAMLSNLRIDRGCWNSLLFPESMRIVEPYVRIDEAAIGDAPGREALHERITTTLFGLAQLDRERDAWCRHGAAPLRIRGTYEGRAFETADLCSEWPLPEPAMPGWRRYQANLSRACPQACIH